MSDGERAVIQRKLAIPEVSERALGRPRLDRLLAMLVERYPVVWVAATAGAGKTTAVVQAARAIERPVAWLTLDATDAAPGRLVTYLEAALTRAAPQVRGVGTGALARRIAHAEAAGLLAEAVGTSPVLLVIDELERLAEAPEALAALERAAALRAAEHARSCSSAAASWRSTSGNAATLGRVAAVGEGDLAFTTEEAARALADVGRGEVDPIAAVEATGGWVAGVLFEAWRSEDHVAGLGGEADPLYGYLSSQILELLDDDDREFLVATSLLEEVSPAGAEALGQHGAGDACWPCAPRTCPVTWAADGLAMRCHTRFREFLLECLRRRGDEHVRALRAAHGDLLAARAITRSRRGAPARGRARRGAGGGRACDRGGHRAPRPGGGRALAERAVRRRPRRRAAERRRGDAGHRREQYGRGVRLADRLHDGGHRERLARAPRARPPA